MSLYAFTGSGAHTEFFEQANLVRAAQVLPVQLAQLFVCQLIKDSSFPLIAP
jgi:hypothetical protein